MTREEAIERLLDLQDGSGQTYEAIRRAIEALSATNTEKLSSCGDLISRADAIDAVDKQFIIDAIPICKEIRKAIIQLLKGIPSAEAVEVVRCKDCKYWHSNTEFCDVWSFANIAQRTLADDYCIRAERREESEVEE